MTDADGIGADPYAQWDAAYILGSLSPTERRDYEEHLAGCPACRAAVGDLSGMPGLLGMLSRDEALAIGGNPEPAPLRPDVLDALLDRVRRGRRRRITGMVVAAAAVLLAVGLLLVTWPQPAPPETPIAGTPVTMTAVAPSSLTATVALSDQGWGTRVEMTCTYAAARDDSRGRDAGDRLAMVAVGRDGTRVQLATWTASEGATATPTGTTSLPLRDIAAVQVVSADTGGVLLQRNQ